MGPAIGIVAAAWAYGSTQLFGRYLQARVEPAQAIKISEEAKSLWSRQRSTYLSCVALGIAAGILAGGLRSAAVAIGFALLWVVFGVLPPLIAFPILARRAGHARGQ